MGEGGLEVGGREIIYLSLHFTTGMISALRWAAMRAILMFHKCEGQSHKTVSIQTTNFEEPKRIRTEVPLLTSLTPYR